MSLSSGVSSNSCRRTVQRQQRLDVIAAVAQSRDFVLPAEFAALLAPAGAVERTILLEPPEPYGELIGRVTPQPFTAMVPEILKYTDWPEIAEIVGAERR